MSDEMAPLARLLWSGQQPSGRGPRPALSRDRIVAEAIRMADADGIGALSMQRLAKQLGAATMSLYRHVPSKDDLVALMLDAAMGTPPALPRDWAGAIDHWARAMRDLYTRHPWVLAVGTGNRYLGPNEAAWGEAATRALLDGGLPAHLVTDTLLSVSAFTSGVTRLEVDPARGCDSPTHVGPVLDPVVFAEFDGPERFPALTAVAMAGATEPRGTSAVAAAVFEFGLAALVAEVATRLSR
ncbi:TetR/AcrR family transcriptional regulator [Nocardia sienata]|uniref:TetR/AcrR family transcriptional regulator n=1 Tax=Nocardia sienata TaxID=248552 RepID=UPI000A0786E2|nr:TetR/AcrR family transcriptional regulator [Nocardia sienata]